jgi:hypothetical protein
MGLYPTKNLLYAKENKYQSEGTVYREVENISKLYLTKNYYTEYIRNANNSMIKNTPTVQLINGQKILIDSFQKKTCT